MYFIKTWIGPSHVHNSFTLLQGHAANVDTFIRNQITNDGLQHTPALFEPVLWNVCQRLELGLSRTNNSLEAFFHVWSDYMHSNPRLSSFVKRVFKEDLHWARVLEEYENGEGIRGGLCRKKKWIKQDRHLQRCLGKFNNTEPLVYMKRIARKISTNIA